MHWRQSLCLGVYKLNIPHLSENYIVENIFEFRRAINPTPSKNVAIWGVWSFARNNEFRRAIALARLSW